ncbi:hypothetical protein BI308_23695 [Roseofilum reptotaenium AO1-A]|uniref:Uncharacterized protein n=1 Tax=Roseofilum reptotaenium AO1-A TaxID=1925591 RepID=A0A1L9QK91_9CYAN|nr:hypothetical protein [Roseofilum reptotaenium]OJJ16240.1 hypothetical protein BI308_23695 [Roseofilum reptotaenium AO1-A]
MRRLSGFNVFKKYVKQQRLMILCWVQILATLGLIGGLFSPTGAPTVDGDRARKRQLPGFTVSAKLVNLSTEHLFATPNSVGAIAIGVAEGTRTPNGGYTDLYFGHTDPGNSKHNLGTFAYQHGADSPEEADFKQLRRLKPSILQLQEEAQSIGIHLGTFELLAGVDLINQSPLAGKDYIQHLKTCYQLEEDLKKAILCARVRSFVNPTTGELEADGLGSYRSTVRKDQKRRLDGIERVLNSKNRFGHTSITHQ